MKSFKSVLLSVITTALISVQGGISFHPQAAAAAEQMQEPKALSENGISWLALFANAKDNAEPMVIPGGQSIGVKLHASGILVVGYHLTHLGRDAVSPAEQAHVHVGDVIVAIDGHKVSGVTQVAQLIQQAGTEKRSLTLSIRRKGEAVETKIKPLYDADSGTYRLGVFIRDSASGVGTLTFYVPKTHAFGALGHVIADADTGQAIEGNGQIVHATVTSIERGESGQPGEVRGSFLNDHMILGQIARNTAFGVFGTMANPPDHGLYDRPIVVERAQDVHVGPAKILTVVSNQKVQAFDVQIVKVNHQSVADVKGMVIRVTDPVLLAKTGGIVQGMSGSPILQDGKLIGAVTHVFVSDPTQGFGIYAQWMLQATQAKSQDAIRSNGLKQVV
ncbi:MAG: SpoIVB peptidase [Firmicutes bacterium]|nr:SpoIVB peptidase [Bacillota bacterium]